MTDISSYYNVTINAVMKSSPSDGSIDPFRIEYYRALPNAPTGNDMNTMSIKKKGFVRWHRIELQLARLGNIYISDILAPGADTNTLPTSVSFVAQVEHGDDSIYTNDENNPGVLLTGADAIERAIARALMSYLYTNQEVWDPTTVPNTQVIRFGYRTIPLECGILCNTIAEANSYITVTEIV